MRDQVSRRGLLKAAAGTGAAAFAGCMSSGNSNNNSKSTENAIKAEDMGEWMERTSDLTYVEIAEESAQMSVGDYNENMQMSGTHIDSAPKRDPVDNPIVDEGSVELTFTEVDSDAPAERY